MRGFWKSLFGSNAPEWYERMGETAARVCDALEAETPDEREDAEINKLRDDLRFRRIKLLEEIGDPECPDGSYSPRQQALWREVDRLQKQEARILGHTEVVEHWNIGVGRRWKR